MANSRFGYVRQAELDDRLLPNTFLVIRLDGKGFTKFSQAHGFTKPNDLKALNLMNAAAIQVLESDLGRGYLGSKSEKKSKKGKQKSSTGIVLAYGQSDEFSFGFGRNCQAYNRRSSKLLTTVLSTFTAAYIHLWSEYFPESPLSIENLPTFDGRIIQYATFQEFQDYFKWRQVDAHINNLYNTTFWALVQQGKRTTQEAHSDLKGTFSKDKHSILFDRFQINYNNELEIFKKGSILIWSSLLEKLCTNQRSEAADPTSDNNLKASTPPSESSTPLPRSTTDPLTTGEKTSPPNSDDAVNSVCVVHQDLVKDQWWTTGPGAQLSA
ncbi:tRNA-His guanylyltransferase [Puccinia graminis f. sp. tritici]|uniref:tRNA(His) guanylyltransferase n=1 Tax=Puccinia graminis f. sp. tritici TaxID=56615 RepID=A0A5B0LZN4_PUCGR|nr:tRNA-His guanylyltransferase [Puccinia graminis f. sp. tritici]